MLRSRITTLTILLADLAALFSSFALAYFARVNFDSGSALDQNFRLLPLLLLFIPIYAAMGLYPGFLLSGPDKLKRLSTASTLGVLFLCGMLFMDQAGLLFSRFILFFFWITLLIVVPFFRFCLQRFCGNFSWWGYQILIFGKSSFTEKLAGQLRLEPWHGYKAAAVFNLNNDSAQNSTVKATPLSNDKNQAAWQVSACKQKFAPAAAIIIQEDLSLDERQFLIKLVKFNLLRIIILPEAHSNITLSTSQVMFCSHSAISMSQKLLSPYRLYVKRCIDLLVIATSAPPTLLFFLLIGLAIILDSRGGVLYSHKRIGQGGREIKIWKFRTMCKNADQLLNDYLEKNPEFKDEWRKNQKLKHDPRITRVGHILRKTSLDELPQLINVLKGEMSLVGPRPIVETEIQKYGEAFETYMRVKPGITGLWQVSGRNDVSYDTRIEMDELYVANWSVWLDIYLLIRTVPEVIKGSGAY
ncbi:MAG: undecaprenyl-phosphate galactose phosphotransferase WbaP [Deltaproteobacteria bacterium]|jgi:Undecaprenyl-phosphate galactose phosphotransferase WbaP|nr:undecaprenyl-phosphate galactose phosphotransferase WbaP [Deltaproteobacteria bacterium]